MEQHLSFALEIKLEIKVSWVMIGQEEMPFLAKGGAQAKPTIRCPWGTYPSPAEPVCLVGGPGGSTPVFSMSGWAPSLPRGFHVSQEQSRST